MTPNELIKAALMMEFDLLWNGGIGIGTHIRTLKRLMQMLVTAQMMHFVLDLVLSLVRRS